MAEIAIKIDAGSGYEDKDILCAFTRRRIRACHAEHICYIRKAPRNASGLILPGSLSVDWFEATHQYRFERVAADTIQRVEIATGLIERFSSTPNERGEVIDVRLFIVRRKKLAHHALFGEDGAEFWYGGRVDKSDAALTRVWSAIQTKSDLRESDHTLWPAGPQDLRSHLFLPVDDMPDEVAIEMESPEVNEAGEVLQKRKHSCDWETRAGLSAAIRAAARNKSQAVDVRRDIAPLNHRTIIDRKPPKENRNAAVDHSP